MDWLKSAVNLLVVLSVLVVVHEWGHFLLAKLWRMRVEDFSLFFGKRLVCLGVRNGTEYNIRSVPLGGFVKIAGMEPDDMTTGLPVYQAPGSSRRNVKLLKGLTAASFSEIDFADVRDDVRATVEEAVGPGATLRLQGKENLRALLMTTGLNSDEHRYIEAILAADVARPDPDGYNSRPIWQRASVIFAGPLFSVLFGYVILCVMGFTVGVPGGEHVAIASIVEGKPAARVGLQPGDRLVAINGKTIGADEDLVFKEVHSALNRPVSITYQRDGVVRTVSATTFVEYDVDPKSGVKTPYGRLGFQPEDEFQQFSPRTSIMRGSRVIYYSIIGTFGALFSKHVGDNVGGIIAIAGRIHEDSKAGPRHVMLTAAMLSVSIGLVNLLPIPILDGGHLALLAIEGLRRRKLSSGEVYAAQMLGLSIIGVLFVWVMYKDILRILPKAH